MKLLLILLLATASVGSLLAQTIQAVWMYNFDDWKGEPNFGNRLLSASALGFDQIYLGVLSHKLDELNYGSKMVEFVIQATSLNIDVHALTLQDPHFSLTYKHNDALERIEDILDYNLANSGAAFTGIHIDPEPHILLCDNDESHVCDPVAWEADPVNYEMNFAHLLWTTPPEETALVAAGGELENLSEPMKTTIKNRRTGIMSEFVTLLQRIRDEKIDPYNLANDPDLLFTSTVGWWYNEKKTGEPNGYLPSGATDLTQYLDAIVPMVYSGGVGETVTDIVSRVDDEIVETNAPTIIGISHESLENFPGGVQAAIAGLEAEFENAAAFEGVSVFQFDDLEIAYPVEYHVAAIAITSGLLSPENFEPDDYSYNFLSPIRTELLCKNSHLGPIATSNLTGTIPAASYEDETGELSSSGTIAGTERVWFLAEESIVLTDGFEATSDGTSDGFFIAEIINELPFCDDPTAYIPNNFNYRFFTSIYGPRMTSSGGIITRPYDFHRGEDMLDKVNDHLPDILNICDGEVEDISTGGDEGNSVIVECDALFNQNPSLGNIYIAYRHLTSVTPGLAIGNEIGKGDLVGIMGGSGAGTASPHLHFSVLKKNSEGDFINLHPMRVFNNEINQHLFNAIDEPPTSTTESEMEKQRVSIFLLDHDNSTANPDENYATFRIAVPYDKTAIRAIIVRNGATYEQTADFEFISEDRDNPPSCCSDPTPCTPDPPCLDDPNIGNLKLFALPFVRSGGPSFTAYGRFINIQDDLAVKVPDHPALTFPLVNEGIFTTPSYVLDIKAKGLPQFFNPFDFEIDVLDIWGNGVRGTMEAPPPPIPLIASPIAGNTAKLLAQPFASEENPASPVNPPGDLKVKIYPNPTAGDELFVEIEGMETGAAEITVSNLSGHLALVQAGEGSHCKIDVGQLTPGAYLVRVKTEQGSFVGKFVRQ